MAWQSIPHREMSSLSRSCFVLEARGLLLKLAGTLQLEKINSRKQIFSLPACCRHEPLTANQEVSVHLHLCILVLSVLHDVDGPYQLIVLNSLVPHAGAVWAGSGHIPAICTRLQPGPHVRSSGLCNLPDFLQVKACDFHSQKSHPFTALWSC